MRDRTTILFLNGRSPAVRIPKGLRLAVKAVTIRVLGHGVLIEPVTADAWPDGFFEAVRIDDNAFSRPEQVTTAPIPTFSQ